MLNRLSALLLCAVLALVSLPATAQGRFKDGEYVGDPVQTFWGELQFKVIIQNGLISDVQFLKYPSDRRRSVQISEFALPRLKAEAIALQRAEVDVVSSATVTTVGFREGMAAVLAKAKK